MSLPEVETSVKEIWEMFKETDRRLDKRFEETAAQLRATDKEIKRLSALFTGQWGKLIESLAESGLLEQLQARGIKITNLWRRLTSHKNGNEMELDFLLTNDTEVVPGEVIKMDIQRILSQPENRKLEFKRKFP